jgi:diaminopimelate decarboxylase
VNALAHDLVHRHFNAAGGELLIGGTPVSQLAHNYGTPVFFYDRSVIQRKVQALRETLPDRFSICFSVKANPNVAILRHFLSLGCGLEIASAGEFDKAVEAGCDPGRILFAGPGKSESELEHVLSRRIGEIHLESLTETGRVSRIAKVLGCSAKVALRVNPAGEAEGGAMRMGGRPAPFGVDEEDLEATLDVILASESLEFSGIHLFAGTQILDAGTLLSQYRHGVEIGRRVFRHTSIPLRRLDFGGGLGIPYFSHEKALDLSAVREGLGKLCAECDRDPAFTGTEFLVEPGRFLVGEAGIYVTRVNDIKISRGKKFLIVDGGMNHHLAASGNLGQTIKRNYPVALLAKLDGEPHESVDVVGPLCTPLDTLARNVVLPRAEIGDLFGIFQSGAYGRSASPLGFLSHPAPPEVLVGDELHVLTGDGTRGSAVSNENLVLHSPDSQP